MKLFTNDKTVWVSESEFFKKYRTRIPNTRIGIYDRYKEKYKPILHWLCVAYNGKGKFWEVLKRDCENDKVGCYEDRVEEIINTCTSNSRKYWRNQCTRVSRRRRTQLFQGRMFRYRYEKQKEFYDNFGYKSSSF
jgi:hypothetical protein